jgi:hypothetical protein
MHTLFVLSAENTFARIWLVSPFTDRVRHPCAMLANGPFRAGGGGAVWCSLSNLELDFRRHFDRRRGAQFKKADECAERPQVAL